MHIWNRRYDKGDKHGRGYRKQPLEDKESFRWVAAARRSKEALGGAESILFTVDREADMFEEFALVPDGRCDVLVRSREDRRLHGRPERLYEHLGSLAPAGEVSLEVRAAKGRGARGAVLAVRFGRVRIARPLKHGAGSPLPEYVELDAVMAEETPGSVPAGEKPVSWKLLTTRPVGCLADALETLRGYALRWQAELVFASLKSKGVDVESSELETGRALKSMAAMSLVTALRVNQLRLARDDSSGTPASIVFTASQVKLLGILVKRLEGRTKKQGNPHKRGCLAWAVWAVARLGGWKGYGSESPPGNKTMDRGWTRFNQLYEGWNLAQILK